MNAAKDDAHQLNAQNIRGTMHPFYLPGSNVAMNPLNPSEEYLRRDMKEEDDQSEEDDNQNE